MKKLFIPIAALAILAAGAQAQTILYFNDTFEDGGGTATRNNDSSTVSTTDIAFFGRGNTGANITVINDSFAGSTKALGLAPGSAGVVYLGSFDSDVSNNNPATGVAATDPRVTLSATVGNYLSLTMDYHYRATPGATSDFRFGLYGDPSQFITADNSGMATDDATGYWVTVPFSGNATITRDVTGTGTILGTGSTIATSTTGGSISDQLKHSLELRITRTATGADIGYYRDGTLFASGSDSSPITSFNLVPFKNGTATTTYSIDNVSLRAVPEPGTFVMLLGGAGMLALLRRRHTAV